MNKGSIPATGPFAAVPVVLPGVSSGALATTDVDYAAELDVNTGSDKIAGILLDFACAFDKAIRLGQTTPVAETAGTARSPESAQTDGAPKE